MITRSMFEGPIFVFTFSTVMSTTLYGWGSCVEGQLGPISSDDSVTQVFQPSVVDWPPTGVGKKVIKMACGYQHTLALDADGLVYSCGSNEFGQLGHLKSPGKFCRVSGIQEQARDIAAGAYHSAAITTSGRVYMWGCNTNHQLGRDNVDETGVLLLDFNHGPIVQISLGLEHTIALTESSEIFAWGSNSHGQLGLGYCSQKPMATPQIIECLSGLPVRQLAAGANHNIIVTPSGSVYTWGSNSRGQLGLGVKATGTHEKCGENSSYCQTDEPTPQLMKSMKRQGVTFAACGEDHSALLTKDGGVFTFGGGRFGQLGNGGSTLSVAQPQRVMELMGETCLQLWCGRRHTVVLVANANSRPRILAFGSGVDGQLGLSNRDRALIPLTVKGPWSSQESSSSPAEAPLVICVFAGGDHCFAITHSSGLACPPPLDFRRWLSCNLGSICTFSEPLLRRYEAGLSPHPRLPCRRRSRKFSSADYSGDISEATYCLEAYSPQTAFRRLESAFGSIGCLASSLLVDCEGRSHYYISRADHGMDLDAAHELQEELFLLTPPDEARRLIRSLIEVISPPRHNFPDLECLRAFVFLSVSPLLETPSTDGPEKMDASSTSVIFENEEPVDWYPTVLAGFAPGFVLGFFCLAINRLDAVPSSVIDSWFKGFQPRFFRRLVANLNNFVAYLCNFKRQQQHEGSARMIVVNAIHGALELMGRLRAINVKRLQPISYTCFYIHVLTETFDVTKFVDWLHQRYSREKTINSYTGQSVPPDFSIFDYPFIFDMVCKAQMLAIEAKLSQHLAMQKASNDILGPQLTRLFGGIVQPYLFIEVSRCNLIADTLDHLANYSPAELKRPLKIRFRGEEAIDDGGVVKEFFMLIMREILNPAYGMFKEYPESRMLWFNEINMETPEMFTMVGALCGLAIYNSIIVDLTFPTALFKKLLDEEPTLDDLKELDPVVANSLQQLLDYEEPDLEDTFALTFEVIVDNYGAVKHVPLIPSGGDVAVTQENKHKFVEKYVDYKFNRSCSSVFEAFKRGFFNVCSGYVIKMFQPSELHSMVVGSEEINWQDLRKNTTYQGEYWDQHPVIQWFWEVLLDQCNLKEKKNFLRFLTGCDRVPMVGLSGIKITIQPNNSGDAFLPVAHTCHNILDLPKYSSKEILKEKFMQAIENTEGFGLV
uniref:HECT domain-containing protein n=1 Tax=Mesocestoides corti TaxID=53468 RepID=A0A5K3EZU1_MESCO